MENNFVLPAEGAFRISTTTVPFINLCTVQANPLLHHDESTHNAKRGTTITWIGVPSRPLSNLFHYPLNIQPEHLRQLLAAAKAKKQGHYVKQTGLFEIPDARVNYQPATHLVAEVLLEGKLAHQVILFVTEKGQAFVEFKPDFAYVRGGNSTPNWNDIPAIWAAQYRFNCPTWYQHTWDVVAGSLGYLAFGLSLRVGDWFRYRKERRQQS